MKFAYLRGQKIQTGVIEETLEIDALRNLYRYMQDIFVSYINVSFEYIFMSKYDINEESVILNAELPKGMNLLFLPFDFSLIAALNNFNITKLSNTFVPSWTFLLSPAPEPSTTANLTFIAVEPTVLGLFIFFLVLVSGLMSLAILDNKKSKTKQSTMSRYWQAIKTFFVTFKDHLWQNINLLFFEDYYVPASIPWRLAFMGWLLGITIISFEISSYLKSEFSETKYDKVETIDDLMTHAGKIKIGVMEGGVEDMLIKNKAKTDEKFQILDTILSGDSEMGAKMSLEDLFLGGVYEQLIIGKLIFISGYFTVYTTMTHHFNNKGTSLLDFQEIYYFSQPLDESYSALVFSNSFVGTPLSKFVNHALRMATEFGFDKPITKRIYFTVDILQWSEPPQLESTELTVKGMESVAMIYLIGNAIAILYFIIYLVAILTKFLCKN